MIPRNAGGLLTCKKCDFKTSFRYNLNRHIANQHENSENVSMSVQPIVLPVELVAMKASNIKNLLTDLKLENLLINFESNGIDVDFLLSLEKEDLKDCLNEIGVNRFADRHKIIEKVRLEKRNRESCVEIPEKDCQNGNPNGYSEIEIKTNQEIEFSITQSNIDNEAHREVDQKECELWENSTQHLCRRCGMKVCILFCSIPDPSSDNEMHVIHKDESKCVPKINNQ